MGVCKSKQKKQPPKLNLNMPLSKEAEEELKMYNAFKEELDNRQKAKWPNAKYTPDIRSVVWDQIRIIRQPRTEDCRNFLIQICLIRPAPKNPSSDHYSDLDPSGSMAWYVNYKYNSYTHHLDEWEALRPTRLVPQKMDVVDFDFSVLLDKVPIETGNVTWSMKAGTHDYHGDYTGYEMLVCPGRHIDWPKVSGAFGTEPQFPMHLMKGSVIKKLDASKPFAIPRHEQAMKDGGLVAVCRVHLARGEEADMEVPDLIKRGINERVSSTAPYVVPIFELTEGRGYLAPTCRILFISHRWLTPDDVHPEKGHPDDATNIKLIALQKLVKDDDFVFFDLWSIPQAPDRVEDRVKAIHSLNTYVDWSSEFIALCPGEENRRQYGERGWTNLELVSALTPVVKKTIVNKFNTDVVYGSTADRIGFVNENAEYEALENFTLRDPKLWKFGHPEDAQAIVPVAHAVKEKFEWIKQNLDKNGDSYVGKSTFHGSVNVKQVLEALKDM